MLVLSLGKNFRAREPHGDASPARGCAVTVLHAGSGNRQIFSGKRRRPAPGRHGLSEVCPMAESFGARLRQQRERQLIALSTIADQTKINQSLLEGLEQDDVSYWPCGIFRRSFIRAYAQSIGLEPEAVVREFL